MELKLDGISKSYDKGKTYAIQNISAVFTPGVYGILGANGAGKSTILNMITDNLTCDYGTIILDGNDIHALGEKYRQRLGYMPQQQGLYETFTADTFLWYMAALKGMKKKEAKAAIEELLDVVGLKQDRYKKLKAYSGGMKQRILIAQALLNEPKLLILDEPANGLDPAGILELRGLLRGFPARGITVLLSSHILSEVQQTADHIGILSEGVLKYSGKVNPGEDLETLFMETAKKSKGEGR